jgi:N-acetylglucosamine-6-phosphate deacetylase
MEASVIVTGRIALDGARLVLPGGVVEGDRLAVEGERIAGLGGDTEPGDLGLGSGSPSS